jgi:hypothetical protein
MAALTAPGVATTTWRLSPFVENTAGSPISTTATGKISHPLTCPAAHGPATHATTSTPKRSPPEIGVSKECPGAQFSFMFNPQSKTAVGQPSPSSQSPISLEMTLLAFTTPATNQPVAAAVSAAKARVESSRTHRTRA